MLAELAGTPTLPPLAFPPSDTVSEAPDRPVGKGCKRQPNGLRPRFIGLGFDRRNHSAPCFVAFSQLPQANSETAASGSAPMIRRH
jgi:hypothetical protein